MDKINLMHQRGFKTIKCQFKVGGFVVLKRPDRRSCWWSGSDYWGKIGEITHVGPCCSHFKNKKVVFTETEIGVKVPVRSCLDGREIVYREITWATNGIRKLTQKDAAKCIIEQIKESENLDHS